MDDLGVRIFYLRYITIMTILRAFATSFTPPYIQQLPIYSLITFRGNFYFDTILINYNVMLINAYRNLILRLTCEYHIER